MHVIFYPMNGAIVKAPCSTAKYFRSSVIQGNSRSNPIPFHWHRYTSMSGCTLASETVHILHSNYSYQHRQLLMEPGELASLCPSCPVSLFVGFSMTFPFEQLRSKAKHSRWQCLRLLMRCLHYATWLFWYKKKNKATVS